MPIKLSVGINKKVGQPRFGSYGAHCALEVELAPAELASLDELQGQIRRGLDVCRAAVEAELAFQRRLTAAQTPLARAAAGGGRVDRPATRAQMRAVYAIVRRRRLDLYRELADRFDGRGLDQLTLAETSRLIDELHTSQQGELSQA